MLLNWTVTYKHAVTYSLKFPYFCDIKKKSTFYSGIMQLKIIKIIMSCSFIGIFSKKSLKDLKENRNEG